MQKEIITEKKNKSQPCSHSQDHGSKYLKVSDGLSANYVNAPVNGKVREKSLKLYMTVTAP